MNPPPSSNKIPLKKVPTKGSPLAVPAGGVPGQNIPPKQGQEVSPGPGQNTNPGQEQGPPPTSGSQETQGPGARPTPDANGIGPFPYEPNQPPPIDSQWDQFLDDCPYQAGDRCPCYAFCKTGYCDPKNPRQCVSATESNALTNVDLVTMANRGCIHRDRKQPVHLTAGSIA